ncbi:IS982 family transposase [Streptomyces sp. GMY02]|uniref:IS982 family transposase n=1 Tax=Streptomyces sp. GMY02 TaxID=1333528 RepID=UPI001C2C8B8D|nr:IS982 family transposase [Streptomyces sp. GMY02]QXE39615.1 IS982 family transposase [Streptomyces sp. GMY02]
MKTSLDALLAALYVFIDDHVAPRRRIGRPPKLTDAELLCLAVVQVLLGFPSARHWIRFAHARLGHLFRYLPQQSAYNKRLNAAGPLISHVIEALARQVPTWHDDLRLIDSTPVACAASRETVRRSALAGQAGYGYCRSHSRFFWGFRLYLLTTAEGMPVSWCLANPKPGERQVMTALLQRDHHLVRSGQVILADKGFAGREFETFLTERLGVHLVRPDRKDEPVRHGRLARARQWIEAVFDTLKGQLSLEQHGGRTPAGVFARTGQRLLALATAIWHNWTTGAKTKRSLIAYDH